MSPPARLLAQPFRQRTGRRPLLPIKNIRESLLEAVPEKAAGPFLLLEGAELHEADGRGELRLVEGGLDAADGVGLAQRCGQLKYFFRELQDIRNPRAA